MNATVINVKVQPSLKTEVQEVAQELGLTVSALTQGFYKNLVRTRAVTFGMREEPSEYFKKVLAESMADVKAGRVMSFSNGKKALGYLDRMITDGRKRRKN